MARFDDPVDSRYDVDCSECLSDVSPILVKRRTVLDETLVVDVDISPEELLV